VDGPVSKVEATAERRFHPNIVSSLIIRRTTFVQR